MSIDDKTPAFMPAEEGYSSGIGISHWVYAAKNIGADLEQELVQSGLLQPSDYDPLSRVSGECYEKVLISVILASGDPLCGLHIGQQLLLARYGLVAHALLQSRTLEQALDLVVRYQELIGNMGRLTFHKDAQHKWLEWRVLHENPVLRRHTSDCIFAMLVQTARLGSGNQSTAPERIELVAEAPSPSQQQEMERFFQCPLHFGMSDNLMFLSDAMLSTTLNPFDQSLAVSLETELAQQLAALQGQDTLLGQLKHQLRLLMQSSQPRRQQVADRMGVSVRTLDRRMAEEQISWQELLDTTRASMARELLTQTELTMTDISQKLGFSDVRSFQRRFRHWTGMAPSDFRLTQPPSD